MFQVKEKVIGSHLDSEEKNFKTRIIFPSNKITKRDFFQQKSSFDDGFLAERDNLPAQKREIV